MGGMGVRRSLVFFATAILTRSNDVCLGFSLSGNDAAAIVDHCTLEKLRELLSAAHIDMSDVNVDVLSGSGFCNALYRIQTKDSRASGTHCSTFVAKIFSPLALQRLDPNVDVGHVDSLASDQCLGPKLISATRDGILMECVDGSECTEADLHGKEATGLCQSIARCIAQFHAMEATSSERTNMLWHSIEVMLSLCQSSKRLQVGNSEWSTLDLKVEVARLRKSIEELRLPLVLGHGDFKPSNVIVTNPSGVLLIDFELSGMNYRGFDIGKLFRTSTTTRSSEPNFESFIEEYVAATNRLKGTQECGTNDEVLSLSLEARIMQSLSWLEAAIFFQCLRTMDPNNEQKWKSLASARLVSYESLKAECDLMIDRYRKLKTQ